jgi:iron complex transport system ATP-binding protein
MLCINNLAIGYKSKKKNQLIAEGLNATLHSGELTCLIGSNGIGKSTLLRTLAGFQKPIAGEILISGKSITDYSAQELAQKISVVLTEKVTGELTVTELVGMGRSPYTGFFGKLTAEDDAIVQYAIEQVQITHLAQRTISTLSDGERQKAMIAKALAQQTPLILLDDPTAFLDHPSKKEILQLLKQLSREQNKIIFLSTHDLELALSTADKIWTMNKNGLIPANDTLL